MRRLFRPPFHRSARPTPRAALFVSLVLSLAPAGFAAAPPTPHPVFERAEFATPASALDAACTAQWQQLGLTPAPACSDAVFVRRAFLDVIGTLPTATETRRFLADPAPDKRRALIEALLARDEFADYWAMKWSDLLRVKAEFPINLWPNAAQAYHRWLHTAVRDNLRYDEFARTLLTANGSNFRVGPANFYRAVQGRDPESLARAVALTFVGERAEKWPAARREGLAAFFAQVSYKPTGEWKEEIVFFDPARDPGRYTAAVFPDGRAARLAPGADPRAAFADWLVARDNPFFARAFVNRAWSWFFGRGIVHEPDDLRADNPPANPALLAALEREFVAGGYDVKQLFRLILNSQTYQRSSLAPADDPRLEAQFAVYPLRRLEAEVLIDALNQITGTTEKYSSAIPEPYTYIPETQRAIALPDGSITSSFLETFGRAARDNGLESERNNGVTSGQRLHLLNSTHIKRKLETGRGLQPLLRAKRPLPASAEDLYLTLLSRRPTDDEIAAISAYAEGHDTRTALLDTAWALINSAEFLYRH